MEVMRKKEQKFVGKANIKMQGIRKKNKMSTGGHVSNSDKNEAFQDYYADDYSHCYGCGRLNEHGLQIKSYWDGSESICRFLPKKHYTGGKKISFTED